MNCFACFVYHLYPPHITQFEPERMSTQIVAHILIKVCKCYFVCVCVCACTCNSIVRDTSNSSFWYTPTRVCCYAWNSTIFFLIMFCIWTFMFYLIIFICRLLWQCLPQISAYVSSWFQKEWYFSHGLLYIFSIRCSVVVYCWLFIYPFSRHVFGLISY